MSLKIRLARGGSHKRPYYNIVIAQGSAPRDGRFIEKIGSYNPMLPKDHADRVKLDTEKASAWLKKGAQPTDRVARFLGHRGLLTYKASNNPERAKPGKKRTERAEAKAAKLAAPAEASKAEG